VGAVIDPVAARRNPLARRDRGSMANQGDQLAVASDLNPNDAKSILSVLVGDALDQSREHLAVGWFWLDLHEPVARLGVSHQQALYGDGNPVDSPSLNIVRRFDSWRAFDTLHHKNCCDSSLRFYEATMKR
jgi:hypothetical protein